MNPITFGEAADFRASVEACGQAGIDAMELWLPHVDAFLADGHSAEDARAVLDDNGVRPVGAGYVAGLIEVEGQEKAPAFDRAKARFELCEALGAPAIICVGDGPSRPAELDYIHATDRLREVADLAASFGVAVALEFVAGFPFIGTLDTALRIVRQAEHGNLGVALDFFHFYVGRSKMADLAALREHDIVICHLNDALDRPREIVTDAERVMPGEGCFPIADIIAGLAAGGFDGYYSLELFNRALWERPPAEVARMARTAFDSLGA
jgi:sugar phosphate isomerase/epimerase